MYAMKPGVARLFREARQSTAGADPDPGGDWSAGEVVAVVGDYLEMLRAEIAGQQYVKAPHRRALLSRLNPVRTGGAVEYKHQDISAAMLDLGLPWIRATSPRATTRMRSQTRSSGSCRQTRNCSGHCAAVSKRARRRTAKMTLRQKPPAYSSRQYPRRRLRPSHHPARAAAQDATRTTGSCTRRTPAGADVARNW